MKYNELIEFVNNTNAEERKEYFKLVYDRLTETAAKVEKLAFYMFLVVVAYFLASDKRIINEITIGPFKIDNYYIVTIVAPALMSYFLFQYLFLGQYIGEHTLAVKYMFSVIYKKEITTDEIRNNVITNSITRKILPYSLWTELTNMELGWFGYVIVVISWLIAVFTPLYFIGSSGWQLYLKFGESLLHTVSLFITVWFSLCSSYLLIRYFVKMVKIYRTNPYYDSSE